MPNAKQCPWKPGRQNKQNKTPIYLYAFIYHVIGNNNQPNWKFPFKYIIFFQKTTNNNNPDMHSHVTI